MRVCQEESEPAEPAVSLANLAWAPGELHAVGCGLLGWACADLTGVPIAGMWAWQELLIEHWHDRLLWFWHCQRLHTLMDQVTVAVGTMTFEFPGLCLEFCLHNAVTTWVPPPPFSLLFGISSLFFFYLKKS